MLVSIVEPYPLLPEEETRAIWVEPPSLGVLISAQYMSKLDSTSYQLEVTFVIVAFVAIYGYYNYEIEEALKKRFKRK